MINIKCRLGLALSGGASKGLAHVYVLKKLEENNIPIYCLSGTSAGAIIAGLYAYGYSILDIENIMLEKIMTLVQYHWKYVNWRGLFCKNKGLFKIDPVYNLLCELFNNCNFSELKYPLSIAVTNLIDGSTEYITEGSVADAITYSITFPFMFSSHKNNIYYDGGLLENVPSRGCSILGADKILAVDLKKDFLNDKRYLNSHLSLLRRVMDVVWQGQINEDVALADKCIKPKCYDFNFLSFDCLVEAKKAVDVVFSQSDIEEIKSWF